MDNLDIEDLKFRVNKAIDEWFQVESVATKEPGSEAAQEPPKEERKLPEGKRVVRTKQSGDRVYMLDEAKKTRHWITNPEVLDGLGFKMEDVTEVEDAEMLRFQMGAALYRVENADA